MAFFNLGSRRVMRCIWGGSSIVAIPASSFSIQPRLRIVPAPEYDESLSESTCHVTLNTVSRMGCPVICNCDSLNAAMRSLNGWMTRTRSAKHLFRPG